MKTETKNELRWLAEKKAMAKVARQFYNSLPSPMAKKIMDEAEQEYREAWNDYGDHISYLTAIAPYPAEEK